MWVLKLHLRLDFEGALHHVHYHEHLLCCLLPGNRRAWIQGSLQVLKLPVSESLSLEGAAGIQVYHCCLDKQHWEQTADCPQYFPLLHAPEHYPVS